MSRRHQRATVRRAVRKVWWAATIPDSCWTAAEWKQIVETFRETREESVRAFFHAFPAALEDQERLG